MKYTRYDVKSRKKNDDWKTTMMMIFAVTLLAILIASAIFFKFFYKEGNEKATGANKQTEQTEGTNNGGENNNGNGNEGADPVVPPPAETTEEQKEKPETEEKVQESTTPVYTMVQAGYFSTKESADSVKATIGNSAMVLSEDGKFRVVCYIGSEEEAQKISDELTSKNVENTKARFNMPEESLTDKSIKEMVKGALDIAEKSDDEGVASVKTTEFKSWTNEIKEETEDDKFNLFKGLKDNINKLPDEVKANDRITIYQMVYDTLKNYR